MERMALYNKGLSDKEMAEILYLDISTVVYWRKIRNLAPNKQKMRRDVERMLDEGMTCRQISEAAGCHLNTVYKYRKMRKNL